MALKMTIRRQAACLSSSPMVISYLLLSEINAESKGSTWLLLMGPGKHSQMVLGHVDSGALEKRLEGTLSPRIQS